MDHFSKENGVLNQMLELTITANDEVIDIMLSEILTDMGKDGRYQKIEIIPDLFPLMALFLEHNTGPLFR